MQPRPPLDLRPSLRIRLRVAHVVPDRLFPLTYLDAAGTVQPVRWLRLVTNILIGPDGRRHASRRQPFRAMLDLGAPFSVFPRHDWIGFESQITRLDLNPEELARRPPGMPPTFRLGGSSDIPYFLGKV